MRLSAHTIMLGRPGRMRRPSPLPRLIPTKSSFFQRLLWFFVGER